MLSSRQRIFEATLFILYGVSIEQNELHSIIGAGIHLSFDQLTSRSNRGLCIRKTVAVTTSLQVGDEVLYQQVRRRGQHIEPQGDM
jgi:hypothetical protein